MFPADPKSSLPHLEQVSAVSGASSKKVSLVLVGVVLLAVDELNPVKVLCHYTSGAICARNVALAASFALAAILVKEFQRVLYHVAKLFFRSTMNNIFFRSVEIIGQENVPKHGPLILTGNHNNQFVDGVLLLTNCRREIAFMIAEKSWKRPMVGFLARAFRCIPVSRPQDTVISGTGLVLTDGTPSLRGEGTRFLAQVQPGGQVQIRGLEGPLKVKEVLSDTQLTLEASAEEGPSGPAPYKVLPKVDQSAMYSAVFGCLAEGKCLGIFPEGGSHDRTDLLPLKAGVAVIALNAFSKHHIRVPIVPVGLNYLRGHHFRGRVVVEFGAPVHVDDALYAQHETDKRLATDALLQTITTAMRSVIVPVPDYRSLQLIYTARRLYVPSGVKLTSEQTMDLNRRFAEGIRRFVQNDVAAAGGARPDAAAKAQEPCSPATPGPGGRRKALWDDEDEGRSASSTAAVGNLTQEQVAQHLQVFGELKEEMEDYITTLKQLGLRDHQVTILQWGGAADLVGGLLYVVVVFLLGVIPQLMFNMPVWLIARAMAVKEQKKALQNSKVKLAARDVVLSYKILYCLALVPVLFIIYSALLFALSGLSTRTCVLLTLGWPAFSFCGVKASEQGVHTAANLAPLLMRLLPGPRAKQDALLARRCKLQARVRKTVKQCGPLLGDLYTKRRIDWNKEIRASGEAWELPSPRLGDNPPVRPRLAAGAGPEAAAAPSGTKERRKDQ